MALRKRIGAEARRWGFRTRTGPREIVAMRLRGEMARRRYVTSGGRDLFVRDSVEIVKRDGGKQDLVLGDRVYLAERCRLVFEGPAGRIELDDDVFVNARSEIRARQLVRIGARSLLAFDVTVMDTNHHDLSGSVTTAPTVVGADVWVGARAMILRGVSVGDGAVVAAGSIVTSNVPARSLVAGNPARVIREGVTWSR